MSRVDKVTMCCKAHDVQGCIVCMCDDFHDWLDAKKERRHQIKQEWRETPIHERYDLGGEA